MRSERTLIGLMLLATGLLPCACGGTSEEGCSGALSPGDAVVATVVDGTTGQRICDATVTASVGSAMPTTLAPAGIGPTHCDYLSDPPPRPGVYTITASHDGYATPAAQTVSVTTGACNVIQPQAVTITMTKQ